MTLNKQIEQRKAALYFIELNKNISIAGEVIKKGLDLPVDSNVLTRVAKLDTDFDFKVILKNMCLIIGLDADFELNHIYRKLIESMVKNPYEYALHLGVLSARIKQYIDALAFFKAALSFKKNAFEGNYHLGRTYYQLSVDNNDDSECLKLAESSLLKALSVKELGEVEYLLSIIYYNLKMYQAARRYAIKALSGDLDEQTRSDLLDKMPFFEDKALYEQGYTAIINQRYQEGLERLLSISELGEDDWHVQFFIGVGYRAQGVYQKAIMHLNKARDLNPSRAEIYAELGNCYMSIGDMTGAKNELADGLKLFPLDTELLLAMSLATYYSGDAMLAQSFYDSAVKTDPDHQNLAGVKAVLEGEYDD